MFSLVVKINTIYVDRKLYLIALLEPRAYGGRTRNINIRGVSFLNTEMSCAVV